MVFELSTTAFAPEGSIPRLFTCDGPDASPPLSWRGAPSGTHALALIMDDPDAPAGTWLHWLLYDLPASVHELPQGVPAVAEPSLGGRQGRNDFGKLGYGGPCPPRGRPHRYYFRLYALSAPTGLPAGVTRGDLEKAFEGQVLARAELMGRYQR